jgi:hypothetical protein
MGRLYNVEDVARWETTFSESVALHLDRLTSRLSERQFDFHLGMLALAHRNRGMVHVANEQFERAISSFCDSVEVRCRCYERFERGVGRPMDAGHFQSLLLAFVGRDSSLIPRLLNHYRCDQGTPASIALGRAIYGLTTGDRSGVTESDLARNTSFGAGTNVCKPSHWLTKGGF